VRDESSLTHHNDAARVLSPTFGGATHIVKFWDETEFPQLATHEFFCLQAAGRCGLTVPQYRLAQDGSALVMERFDLRDDESYRGSYETPNFAAVSAVCQVIHCS
jgi:serine/threonine-protein kinase HipA